MPIASTGPVPRVGPWIQLVSLFGLFLAGGFIGLFLASRTAPGSNVAAAISGVLLPAAFAAGLIVWSGLDLLLVVLRGRRARDPGRGLAKRTGTWFVPLAVLFSSAGGLVVGLLPGGWGIVPTVAAYAGAGTLYGLVAAKLASRGWLPRPNEPGARV